MSIFTFYSSASHELDNMLCASFDPSAPANNCLDSEPCSDRYSASDRVAVPLFVGSHILATVRDEQGVVRPGNWGGSLSELAPLIHGAMAEAAEAAGASLNDIRELDGIAGSPAAWDASRINSITQYWTEVVPAEDALTVTEPDDMTESPAFSDADPAASHPYRVVYSQCHKLCVVVTPFTLGRDLTSFAETMERHHYDGSADLAIMDCEDFLSDIRDEVRQEDDTWGELSPYLLDMVRDGHPALRWKSRGAYNQAGKHIILIKTGRLKDDWEPAEPENSEAAMKQWKHAGLDYPQGMAERNAKRIQRDLQRASTSDDAGWQEYQQLTYKIALLRQQQQEALDSHIDNELEGVTQALSRLNGLLTLNSTLANQQKLSVAESVILTASKSIERIHLAAFENATTPPVASGNLNDMLDAMTVLADGFFTEESSREMALLRAVGQVRNALKAL